MLAVLVLVLMLVLLMLLLLLLLLRVLRVQLMGELRVLRVVVGGEGEGRSGDTIGGVHSLVAHHHEESMRDGGVSARADARAARMACPKPSSTAGHVG